MNSSAQNGSKKRKAHVALEKQRKVRPLRGVKDPKMSSKASVSCKQQGRASSFATQNIGSGKKKASKKPRKDVEEEAVKSGCQSGHISNKHPTNGCLAAKESPIAPCKNDEICAKSFNSTDVCKQRIEGFNSLDPSCIQSVKSALHLSAAPEIVLCRDSEQSKVFEFCKVSIQQQRAGSLYVCGCPGTGKSLTMEKIKPLTGQWAKEVGIPAPEIVSLNCTSFTKPSDIFDRLALLLSSGSKRKSKNSSNASLLKEVKGLVCKSKNRDKKSNAKMLLLIVDEMDFLITRDQSVLYGLFGFSKLSNSRCILIGIANAIDLTDRFLPKLQALNCKPVVVTFPAYSKEQVRTILNQRLKALPYIIYDAAALELCARKVAAASGDMRKALHICRTALEFLELEVKDDLKDNGNGCCDLISTGKEESFSNQRKEIHKDKFMVQIHHMVQALTRTFQSATVDVVKLLPKHQQMIMCSAVRLFRQAKKDANLSQLHAAYLELCKSSGMPAISVSEFSSICSVLSDQGLLSLGSAKEDRLRRVTLRVDEEEITFALQACGDLENNPSICSKKGMKSGSYNVLGLLHITAFFHIHWLPLPPLIT